MHRQAFQNQPGQIQPATDWSRLKERLVYFPGAVVLTYGLWLSLTA